MRLLLLCPVGFEQDLLMTPGARQHQRQRLTLGFILPFYCRREVVAHLVVDVLDADAAYPIHPAHLLLHRPPLAFGDLARASFADVKAGRERRPLLVADQLQPQHANVID